MADVGLLKELRDEILEILRSEDDDARSLLNRMRSLVSRAKAASEGHPGAENLVRLIENGRAGTAWRCVEAMINGAADWPTGI